MPARREEEIYYLATLAVISTLHRESARRVFVQGNIDDVQSLLLLLRQTTGWSDEYIHPRESKLLNPLLER